MIRAELPPLANPSVSIVICSHNHERFVEQAIASALSQTLPCEVVLIEDGSTDGTRDRLNAWRDRLKIVLQDNAGQLAAYERGIRESTGDVVIFLDSDDSLDPEAAAAVAAQFGANVAKVHFRLRVVDEDGSSLGAEIPRALADGDVLPNMLRSGVLYASVPGSGNAYRRSVLERLLPLPKDPHDRHGADLFVIFGSVFFGSVRALQPAMGSYRIHSAVASDTDGLAFGNAELRDDARERFQQRLDRFLAWIPQRVRIGHPLPSRFLDFGTQKTHFARGLFALSGTARRVHVREMLPDLFLAVMLQASYSLVLKVCLVAWMLAIAVLPRRLALPLARRVCNPASRGGARRGSSRPAGQRPAASDVPVVVSGSDIPASTSTGLSASTTEALVYVYAGYLVRYVSLLILIPFYGRVLGAEAYGEVLAAMSLYAVVFTIVSHGFSTVGARDLACNLDPEGVRREFGRHLHARLLLSVFGVAAGVAGTLVSPALHARPLMGVLATVFALSHAFNLGWFYQGLGEFKKSIALEVFGFLCSLVIILSFVRDPSDNWVVLLALSIANILANMMAYAGARRFMARTALRLQGGVTLMRESTPVFMVGGMATLAVGASSYILSLYAPVTEVGYFGSAERIAAIVVALMMPAGQVLLSTVSKRLHGGGDVEEGYALMRRALFAMVGFSVLASLGVAGLAPYVLPHVLGPDFLPSVPLLVGFALMYPFVAFSQVINMYVLIPLRQDRIAMKVAVLGTLVHLGLLFTGAWGWHGPGAVAARVLSEVFLALMLGVALWRVNLWGRLLRRPAQV